MHLNIRSVRNKINVLDNFTNDVDILCLTETHLDSSIPDYNLNSDTFSNIFRKNRNAFGGGAIIYYKRELSSKRRPDIESPRDENIWIEFKIENKKHVLCVLYTPP